MTPLATDLVRPKLRRVDEYRSYHHVALGTSPPEEIQVTLVEGTHRWYEPDGGTMR